MSDEELAKDLGLVSAMTIGIGTMIGAGIFVLPGVAAQAAGPAVIISFMIGGMIALINAASVSEMGTAMPKAGGAYYYINKSLGPMFGSIAGMGDWMGLAFASAFYCIGFGQYLAVFISLPQIWFLNEFQLGALIAGITFVFINYIGAKETGGIQTIIVFILLFILTVFTIVGFFSFDMSTLAGDGGFAPEGTGAILPATALVFVSYLGYAKIATVGEEMKNPGRNLPIAIIGSVAIVTVIYTILMTVMLGVTPIAGEDAAVEVVARAAFPASVGPIGGVAAMAAAIMTLGALLATASSANASILASARINFAMGRDKIVTVWLNEIHGRFATPYRSILVTGGLIFVFIIGLGGDVEVLARAASVLHLIVYALMNAALIVFRETDMAGYDPVFRVPLYPVTPILGAVLSIGLIFFMDPFEVGLAATFVFLAILWYLYYARDKTPQAGELSDYIRRREEELPDSVVDVAESVAPTGGDDPVIMVALANPRTEGALMTLAGAMAKHQNGRVLATHIVTVPDQTSLEIAAENRQRLDDISAELLEKATTDAEKFGVEIETKTVLSHRGIEAVIETARSNDVDTVVMGYGGTKFAGAGRSGAFEDLTKNLPCDFLVLDAEELHLESVLVPTAGGESSDLSAEVGRMLRDVMGVDITLFHVTDDKESGERFLREWADSHQLSDATLLVESGNVDERIGEIGERFSLVIIGSTERGLLSRILSGSMVFETINRLETPVLLTERPVKRSIRERLFGRN